jgi:hypothetical protein
VGKGTGDRAWSEDRDAQWNAYIAQRSGGRHDVEIFRDGLNDEEACELEAFLIGVHGHHLVNWTNQGQDFDYEALTKYHALRNRNRTFVSETRAIEKADPETAIARYKQALATMDEYESLTLERGLIPDLRADVPKCGDPNILDRLTMCLMRLGRAADAIDEADRFFSRYPGARAMSAGKRIQARLAKLKGGA